MVMNPPDSPLLWSACLRRIGICLLRASLIPALQLRGVRLEIISSIGEGQGASLPVKMKQALLAGEFDSVLKINPGGDSSSSLASAFRFSKGVLPKSRMLSRERGVIWSVNPVCPMVGSFDILCSSSIASLRMRRAVVQAESDLGIVMRSLK